MRYKEEETGIGILICIWTMAVIPCLFNTYDDLIGIYISFGFCGVMTLIYTPSLLSTLRFKKKCKNIVMNGTKVQGCIVDYSINRIGDEFDYSVIVTYLDPYTGKEKNIWTPALSFNPIMSLGDKSCSVYILNELYYVTDFVPRKKGQDNIWGKEIDSLEKMELKEQKKMLIFIIGFILIFVLLFLCCMGIIKF